MDRIMAAITYNHICELGSLSAAARSLGISRPMVSRYLDEMEKWAGSRLIHRSTRRLTITPAGEKTLEKTRQLALLSQGIEGETTRITPSGTLRIACAHFTATHLLGAIIPSFLNRYPALRIEVDINNHPVSLVGARIDLAIRITNEPEPGAIARYLGTCQSIVCASPGYLKRVGVPMTPEDLVQHNCLYYSHFSGQSWRFRDKEKGDISVAVSGNFSAGISSLLCDMAAADVGLAMVPEIEARAGLESGRLIQVLPQLEPQPLSIYGLYQSRDHQHAALSLFLDAIKQHLE
ncbi:LysR family transcriptional regulator [Intestinirhabdus alba]|uniref:LysR family transcriptional regulator n=1 Tax=Intestinirhabdus alba TaxID=2899544 RepID=A0A6L6IJZ3_9ENTR|nr:LysR family transcriptional regulator [Intestinirhabdus alba]MTH46264.1 LysR family transcriptional regulator [Intestinirhabdus alba]